MTGSTATPMPAPRSDRAGPGRWVLGPVADLVCIINLFWLLFAGTQVLAFAGEAPQLSLVMLHFLILPHRFVTLGLVFLDREQFATRPRTFLGLALGFTALVFASRAVSNGVAGVDAFVCLVAFDFAWNAYHFAAQHYGLTRIYGRKGGGPDRPRIERWILVAGITYTLMRLSNWATGAEPLLAVLPFVDAAVGAAFVLLILLELRDGVPSLPKLLYLLSVSTLYGTILAGLHFLPTRILAATVAATGFFHSMEYLAIVSFYLKNKARSGTWGARLLSRSAVHWAVVLPLYVAFLGLGTAWVKNVDPYVYFLLVTPVSFLHYAYDGIIWKLRRPQVASALRSEVGA